MTEQYGIRQDLLGYEYCNCATKKFGNPCGVFYERGKIL